MKKYEFDNVVINVGDVYGVEEFYNYLGEDFHDAVSYEDYLNNDVAYGTILLLDKKSYDVEIAFTVENDTLTITDIR